MRGVSGHFHRFWTWSPNGPTARPGRQAGRQAGQARSLTYEEVAGPYAGLYVTYDKLGEEGTSVGMYVPRYIHRPVSVSQETALSVATMCL